MDVILPKWGMSMQEGVIAEWLVTVGDAVTEGQALVMIETEKVETEVESPGSGTIAEILVPAGETAEVGSVIARLS
ncbi:lipoyl domain-containing protein [Ruicaihuangia caeni]|uniref:lipoyl domain-containing protein n=1 Tax=Ruicaihuangia caeni TaxID=3042517 RepID=UPI00338F363C